MKILLSIGLSLWGHYRLILQVRIATTGDADRTDQLFSIHLVALRGQRNAVQIKPVVTRLCVRVYAVEYAAF